MLLGGQSSFEQNNEGPDIGKLRIRETPTAKNLRSACRLIRAQRSLKTAGSVLVGIL
jgi:hypothetical protein